MGLKNFQAILELLQRWFPPAFWPQYREASEQASLSSSSSSSNSSTSNLHPFFKRQQSETPGSGFQPSMVCWPEDIASIGVALDDFNGTVRGLPLGTPAQRTAWDQEARRHAEAVERARKQKLRDEGRDEDADEEDEIEDADDNDDEEDGGGGGEKSPSSGRPASSFDEEKEDLNDPIACPEDLLRYMFERYSNVFYYNNARELHVVCDFIGRTPAIKSILREARPSKPVVWPAAQRQTLFTSNKPFENSIHDFFADPQAKRLLYEYLTTSLLERFPAEGYLPEGSRLVIWGGYYQGKECARPLYVENEPLIGLVGPKELEDPDAPCAEADVMIGYIVSKNLGKCHQLLISKDSDFIPILLSVINRGYKTLSTPRKYRVFFSHKILVKSRISTEEYAKLTKKTAVSNTTAPQQHQQQQQQCNGPSNGNHTARKPEKPSLQPTTSSLYDEEDEILRRLMDDSDDTPAPLPRSPLRPTAVASLAPPLLLKAPGKAAPKGKRKNKNDDTILLKAKIREIIDLRELYENVWAFMFTLHEQCGKCDPIDAFVALLFTSGCDYYKNPPLITFKTLCHVYFSNKFHTKHGCMCPYDTQSDVFRLDTRLFKKLLTECYKAFCNVTIQPQAAQADEYDQVRDILLQRKAALEKTKAAKMPPMLASNTRGGKPKRKPADRIPSPNPLRHAANVHWLVNYYTRSFLPGWTPTNGLECDSKTGLSLHGYTRNPVTERYEFATQVLYKDVL